MQVFFVLVQENATRHKLIEMQSKQNLEFDNLKLAQLSLMQQQSLDYISRRRKSKITEMMRGLV